MINRILLIFAFVVMSTSAIAASPEHQWVYSDNKPTEKADSNQFYAYSTITSNVQSPEDSGSRQVAVKVQETSTDYTTHLYNLTCESNGLAFDLNNRSDIVIPEKEVTTHRVQRDHRDIINAWYAVCKKEKNKIPANYFFLSKPFSFFCSNKGKCTTSRIADESVVGGDTHRVIVTHDENPSKRELILDCDFKTYYDVAQPRQGMINVHPDNIEIDQGFAKRSPGYFEGVNAWFQVCQKTSQKIKTQTIGSKVK